jgi:ribosomal protein L40E
LVGVVFTIALFVPIRNALANHELVAIDMEAIDRAYKQLEDRPNNVGAKFKIAKLVYKRGLHGHAIAVADDALKGMPEDTFGEEHKLVGQWKRQEHDEGSFEPVPCKECGAYNPPGEVFCRRCNAPFLLDHVKGRWFGRDTARKLTAVWIALMGLFVGLPVAAALPVVAAVILMIGLGILVMITLYTAFLGQAAVKKGSPGPTR